ncbi:unnamed protein product, partial [marine sediment metagenome]
MKKELIKQIQDMRKSAVIVYFTGDRSIGPITASRMAEDA